MTPSPPIVCPDLVDKYLEETSIRYVTPRALSDPEPRPPQPPKTGKKILTPPNFCIQERRNQGHLAGSVSRASDS